MHVTKKNNFLKLEIMILHYKQQHTYCVNGACKLNIACATITVDSSDRDIAVAATPQCHISYMINCGKAVKFQRYFGCLCMKGIITHYNNNIIMHFISFAPLSG